MKLFHLKYKANKTQLSSDIQNYRKSWNLVTRFNKQIGEEFFDSLDDKTDCNNLKNKCNPYFPNKYNNKDSKTLLIGNEKTLSY